MNFHVQKFLYLVQFSHLVMSDSSWPMDYSTPGFPVLHYLPEFDQIHVHWVDDVIQPSHSLSSTFPLALNLSQHLGLFHFTPDGPSIGASASVSVLPMNFQGWFPLELAGLISLLSKGLSRVFSSTTIQKHQFFSTQPYGPTLTSIHDYSKSHSFDYMDFCGQCDVSAF